MSKNTDIAIVPTVPPASLPFTTQYIANCEGIDASHPDAGRVLEKTFVKNVGPVLREAALCVALAEAEVDMNDPAIPHKRRRAAQLFWNRNTRK